MQGDESWNHKCERIHCSEAGRGAVKLVIKLNWATADGSAFAKEDTKQRSITRPTQPVLNFTE
jgi:hypothetical protein